MHLDLVDVLRCAEPHQDGWLVCATQVVRGRSLHEGWLGCPTCQAQYAVREGIVHYQSPDGGVVGDGDGPRAAEADTGLPGPPTDAVIRLAAALDLVRPGRLVVLAGGVAAHAAALSALVPTRLVLLDAEPPAPRDELIVAALHGATGIPLAPGQVHGIALDASSATPARLEAAVAALADRGRLVLPASCALPALVDELAADASLRVGERVPRASSPIPLRRRER